MGEREKLVDNIRASYLNHPVAHYCGLTGVRRCRFILRRRMLHPTLMEIIVRLSLFLLSRFLRRPSAPHPSCHQ